MRVVTSCPGLMRTGSFGHALVKGKRYAEASLFSLARVAPAPHRRARSAPRAGSCARSRTGERFVVIGVPAKLLRLAHALFPGAVVRGLGRREPAPAAAEPGEREGIPLPGELFRRGLARSILTALGRPRRAPVQRGAASRPDRLGARETAGGGPVTPARHVQAAREASAPALAPQVGVPGQPNEAKMTSVWNVPGMASSSVITSGR